MNKIFELHQRGPRRSIYGSTYLNPDGPFYVAAESEAEAISLTSAVEEMDWHPRR